MEMDLLNEINRMRTLMGLNEVEMINEISIDQLKTQFLDSGKISQDLWDNVVEASNNKGNLATWLIRSVLGSKKKRIEPIIKPEDVYKYKQYLDIFSRFKSKYKQKDIMSIKTTDDLQEFLNTTLEIKRSISDNPSLNKGVSKKDKYAEFIIGEVNGFTVYELPKGRNDLYGVSCELGSGTEWCTATGKTRKHFNYHISKGPLFIFTNGKDKYQFNYEEGHFMDINNDPIF